MAEFQDLHPPVRSISLPARLQPSSLKTVIELKKLKSCSFAYTSETIQSNVARLAEIYASVQDLVSSPLTHQALMRNQSGRSVEEALDGSMVVIDACSYARELALAMREQVQELQSAMRRNRGQGNSSSCLEKQIQGFLCFRKKAKRDTVKQLRELKKLLVDSDYPSTLEGSNSHLEIVIRVLREVNDLSGSILKSLLEFLSASTSGSKHGGGWSLVSRLMLPSPSDKSQHKLRSLTELEIVDSDLSSLLHGQMKKNDTRFFIETTRRRLETLDSCIQGFEQGLECLFKGLIQYRVSLLNVLTS